MATAQIIRGQKYLLTASLYDDSKPPKLVAEPPTGTTLDFISQGPRVMETQKRPDGVSAIIHSTDVGFATVRVTVNGPLGHLRSTLYTFDVIEHDTGAVGLNLQVWDPAFQEFLTRKMHEPKSLPPPKPVPTI